jgi:hypothetical protein
LHVRIDGQGSLAIEPIAKVFDLLVILAYSPSLLSKRALFTAWIPTIWLVGVTSGICPNSLRTLGISLNTSSSIVQGIHLPELVYQVREHSSRVFEDNDVRIDNGKLCIIRKLLIFGNNFFHFFADGIEQLDIETVSRLVPRSVITRVLPRNEKSGIA